MNKKSNVKWIILTAVLIVVATALGVQMFFISKRVKSAEISIETLGDSVEKTMHEISELKVTPIPEPTTLESSPTPAPDSTLGPEDPPSEVTEGTETAEGTGSSFDQPAGGTLNDLDAQLSGTIAEYEATGASWSYYAEDLTSGATTAYADHQMQAASLIKLYIMGAIYENYDALGGVSLDNNLYNMITVSDNDAANALVNVLGNGDDAAGRAVVTQFCIDHGYSNSSMGRMLLGDKSTGDNYTSVSDCGRFLQSVYNGEFAHSEDMLNLLKNQQRRNKIPSGITDGSVVANKTGELDDVENDVAIVYGPQKTYILCVMTENVSDTGATQGRIAQLATQVHTYFNN